MNQIHAMRVFVRVAETESFRRAAKQLDVSNALVTRSIATLEAHLNTRLINRTTRNVSLTEAGAHFLEGCRGLLEELDHLESTVAHAEREPGGTLRVVASGSISLLSLTPLFASFREKYPNVKIRLALADRHVDLVEDGYDVGIVTSSMVSSRELIERPLGSTSLIPVASPAYLEDCGVPRTPDHLTDHNFLAMPPEQHSSSWHFQGTDGKTHQVSLQSVYTVNNALMLRMAVLEGMGFAILPSQLVANDCTAGTLRRLIPDYDVDDADIRMSIVYPSRQYLPAKTRAFIDYTVEHFTGAKPAPVRTPDSVVVDLHAMPHG